jgi:cytochrome c biogenesis protein CcmG/thiol:disulfide interchange protein DsbE
VGRLKLFVPLLAFLLVVGFFYLMINRIGEGTYNPQSLPAALINHPIPAFDLPHLERFDKNLTETDMLGEIALVNVWATWCPSCHAEHGYLQQLASERGIVIYGVNYKDEALKALQWLKLKGNPYRFNVFDKQGKLGLDLGVTGAPETYLIDHRGFVRLRYQGPLDERVWQQKFVPVYQQLQREQQEASS